MMGTVEEHMSEQLTNGHESDIEMSPNYGTMPLAIVGMACKFAGGISSPEKLWDFVSKGQSAWSTIPDTKFNLKAFHHPQADNTGTTNIKGGYFLQEDVGLFDPAFFGLSADMTAALDPQIRMFLELTYESFESAGISIDAISGSKTSVFAGTFVKDYHDELLTDPLRLPRHMILGNYSAMLSNRVSHFFNLKGPSTALDTGCSTSMVGLHLACQGLRSGESDCAVIGGVNLLLGPDSFVHLSNLGSCGPEGRCYSFDHRAQGYGRGEGAAVLVVKRLSDALRDHDPIRAVIRETAINQDGRTATIASPDADAQHDLIRACYERAGLDPLDTILVEAHGTGTTVGDPIEARAIGTALRPAGVGQRAEPVRLASIKTNIGHTEAASGLAGVIKMVKSLETGLIAPSINFEKANPNINLDGLGLAVVTKLEDWPADAVRRASVNNFGYGGTNGHLILESAPPAAHTGTGHENKTTSSVGNDEFRQLVMLSARSKTTLRDMASNLSIHLRRNSSQCNNRYSLKNLAYTLTQRRSQFPWRVALSARSVDHLADLLAQDGDGDGPIHPVQALDHTPRLAFVFNGQGAQWFGMGRALMDAYPTYLRTLEACDAAIQRMGATWSLVEELRREKDHSRVDEVRFSMPLSCAVQLGLVRLLAEWGVEPTAVVGHSTGEVAAAFAAGALSLDEAMAVTFCRGQVNGAHVEDEDEAKAIPGLAGSGGMLAVGLGPSEVEPYLKDLADSDKPGKVVIACFNSPSSVTLSGDIAAIDELHQKFQDKDVFARKLKVQAAFHSHRMLPLSEDYGAALSRHMSCAERVFTNSITFFSTVTGAAIEDARDLGPSYWVTNMVQPVKFTQAVGNMVSGVETTSADGSPVTSNIDFIVELGAHGALAGPIRQILGQPSTKPLGIAYGSCLDRGKDAVETAQTLAGKLIQLGYSVNSARVNRVETGVRGGKAAAATGVVTSELVAIPDLPSYPWNKTKCFWAEPRPSYAHRFRKHAPNKLVGCKMALVNDQAPVWRHVLRCSDLPWLRDHVIQSQVVFPGAGYIAMAIEVMRQQTVDEAGAGDPTDGQSKVIRGYRLRDVELSRALIVPQEPTGGAGEEGVEIQISLDLPDTRSVVQDWRRFRISAVTDVKKGSWELIASGLVAVEWGPDADPGELGSKSSSAALRSTPGLFGPGAVRPSTYRRKIKPQYLFKTLRENEIRHGPSFQNLDGDILLGEGRCFATVNVADWDPKVEGDSDACNGSKETAAPIHPTTLDSVIVAAYASRHSSSGSLKEATTAIPKSIKAMYISSQVARDPGGSLHVHFSTRWYNKAGFGACAAVYNAKDSRDDTASPVLEIEDLRCQNVGMGGGPVSQREESESEGALPSGQQLAHCLVTDWKRSFALNDPSSLAQALSSQAAAQPQVEIQVEEERVLVRDLQRAAYYCVSDALSQLTAEDMAGLTWYHKRFHDCMLKLEREAAADELAPRSSRWATSAEGAKRMLIDKVEAASTTGALAMRIGKNLLAILRGQTAPLELMLQDSLLNTFYLNCLHFPRANAHAASLVRCMAEEKPSLRILEIGGGTAACTLPVLKALSRDSAPLLEHYTFTDVSMGFFESARQKLAPWDDVLSYAALDIEQDPAEQGFEPGSYDVIVAAAVLHATKNMQKTMRHVRGLLKPGGKLILVETVVNRAYLHMIFGTLPGWWLSEEPERKYDPNMCIKAWDATLRSAGFSGVEAELWDCEDRDHRMIASMVSSAVVSHPTPPVALSKAATLLYDSRDAPPVQWTCELKNKLATELGVSLTVEALSPAFVPDGRLCLFVSGVDGQAQQWPADEAKFTLVQKIVTRCKALLWITAGSAMDCEIPENALHIGLLRTARLEDAGRRYVSLDLDPSQCLGAQGDAVVKVFRATMAADLPATTDWEYAVRHSELFVPRVCPDACEDGDLKDSLTEKSPEMQRFVQPDGSSLRLVVDTPGLVDSLVFRQNPDIDPGRPLAPGSIEVAPCAFGLNFHDVMTVMGMLQQDVQELGFECAGIVTRVGEGLGASALQVGDRVCGLTVHGHIANRVRVPRLWMAKIPASMPFETAASFPLVFVTAYYSLFDAGRCGPEDTVLIHAAAGGVGQACIVLARWRGVPVQNILVTAGTREKRAFLVAEYGLLPSHVFSSRDDTFVRGVLDVTAGRGVDIVINSLSGKLLHESFHLVAPLGRFVEIGKRDIDANKAMDMEPFQKAVSFVHVDVIQLCDSKPALIQRILTEVVSLVASEAVRNVAPVTITRLGDIVRTFRTMQTGKHMGKLVLTVGPDDTARIIKPPNTAKLRPDATYMIVGGVSGLGLSVARYLVDHGARTLLLVSRNAVQRSDAPIIRQFQQQAAQRGARLVIRDCDIANADAMRHLVEDCRRSSVPVIRGVVHGGMVLNDAIIEHMAFSQWQRALEPKLHGTRHIADILDGDDHKLDFFVMLSSLCGFWGDPSQANYAAGNTFQDALARHRSARGLGAAVTIDLGGVDSVGYLADSADYEASERLLRIWGHRHLTEAELLGLMDCAIRRPVRASPRTAQIAMGMTSAGQNVLRDARFALMPAHEATSRKRAGAAAVHGSGEHAAAHLSMYEAIAAATSGDVAAERVQSALVGRLSDMFAIPEKEVDPRKPLAHFGVDSLVAVELRNWIVPNARVELTIFELLRSPSLAELAAKIVEKSCADFVAA